MTPGLEATGIRMMFNECETIRRNGAAIYLAGIDDAHFYRADDIARAAAAIPRDAFSILLSHTPETYQQAAAAGFDVMLSGHTHGGQICLPGGIAVKLDVAMPRRFGAGAWRYRDLSRYRPPGAGPCVVTVRFH